MGDLAPSRCPAHLQLDGRTEGWQVAEGDRVPDPLHEPAHRRVDQPAGGARGVQGSSQGPVEERRHPSRPRARAAVDQGELGVGLEPAARPVDGADHLPSDRQSGGERRGLVHHHDGGRSHGGELGRGQHGCEGVEWQAGGGGGGGADDAPPPAGAGAAVGAESGGRSDPDPAAAGAWVIRTMTRGVGGADWTGAASTGTGCAADGVSLGLAAAKLVAVRAATAPVSPAAPAMPAAVQSETLRRARSRSRGRYRRTKPSRLPRNRRRHMGCGGALEWPGEYSGARRRSRSRRRGLGSRSWERVAAGRARRRGSRWAVVGWRVGRAGRR